MRVSTRVLAAALLVLGAGVPAAGVETGRITVGSTATVVGATVTLADVATLEGAAESFADVALGPAPGPGASRRLDGRTILRRLREAGFDGARVRYVIPATVRVARAAQEIGVEEIERAVEAAAPELLAPGERLRELDVAGPVRVPLGGYELRVAPPPASARGATRRFDVEVVQEARVVASTSARARIAARGTVVVMRRPLARGATVALGDLAVEERDLVASPASLVTEAVQAAGMQARVPLAVGTPLTFQMLESPLLVRRGDLVTLIVETPGMRLTVPGEAREQGGAGDPVRVLNQKSQRELSGQVVERGVVVVQY